MAASWNAFFVSWILVDWKERNPIRPAESPWPETLRVYIGDRGQFFVNGKTVKTKDLEATPKEELARRMDTVYAIDTIQGSRAKVVWITRKMRITPCQLVHVLTRPIPHS